MQEITLYNLVKFYTKKWLWITLISVIAAGIGLVYNNYIQVPLYKSNATLLLVSTDEKKSGQDSTRINNYIELIKSRRVLEPVISDLNQNTTYEQLVGTVNATNEKNTEFLKVSVVSKDPQTSKKVTDAVVTQFQREIKKIYRSDRINVVDVASMPNEPYNVRTALLITLSGLAGLLASFIFFFFMYDFRLARMHQKEQQQNIPPLTKKETIGQAVGRRLLEILIGNTHTQQTDKIPHEPPQDTEEKEKQP